MWSSIFISAIAGIFFGYSMISEVFNNFMPNSFIYYGVALNIYLGVILTTIFFIWLGVQTPRFSEILIAAISLLIIIQFIWDVSVFDTNNKRDLLLFGSLGVLFIDLIMGVITFKNIKSISKKQLGA